MGLLLLGGSLVAMANIQGFTEISVLTVFGAGLVVAAGVADYLTGIVPNPITIGGTVVVLGLLLLLPEGAGANGVLGAAVGYASLSVVSLIIGRKVKGPSLGGGLLKLGLLCGAVLGPAEMLLACLISVPLALPFTARSKLPLSPYSRLVTAPGGAVLAVSLVLTLLTSGAIFDAARRLFL